MFQCCIFISVEPHVISWDTQQCMYTITHKTCSRTSIWSRKYTAKSPTFYKTNRIQHFSSLHFFDVRLGWCRSQSGWHSGPSAGTVQAELGLGEGIVSEGLCRCALAVQSTCQQVPPPTEMLRRVLEPPTEVQRGKILWCRWKMYTIQILRHICRLWGKAGNNNTTEKLRGIPLSKLTANPG